MIGLNNIYEVLLLSGVNLEQVHQESRGDVKALFYIEPKEEHNRVQNIGCRLLLTEKLIHAGFKKGGVFNLPDGRVEVILEGNKKDIELFYEDIKIHLVEWLSERSENKERLKKLIGNPGICFSGLEFKESLRVLDIGLYSHSLEMGQLQKGVDVYYDLMVAINKLSNVLDKNLKS